eukprot:1142097-Amphidinium_carterae.1
MQTRRMFKACRQHSAPIEAADASLDTVTESIAFGRLVFDTLYNSVSTLAGRFLGLGKRGGAICIVAEVPWMGHRSYSQREGDAHYASANSICNTNVGYSSAADHK